MTMIRQITVGCALGVFGLLSGCVTRPNAVPSSAMLMTEGQGAIVFRPTEFGRVYVSDQTDDKILYQADINKGEVVELDARADKIAVGGRTVSDRTMEDGHNYRIFFEPMSKERVVKYRVTEEEIRREPAR